MIKIRKKTVHFLLMRCKVFAVITYEHIITRRSKQKLYVHLEIRYTFFSKKMFENKIYKKKVSNF